MGQYESVLHDDDRKLLQAAACLVADAEDWIFKNAKIIIRGRNIHIEFIAGNGGNLYIVQLNGLDQPSYQINQRNLRLKLRDGFKQIFSPFQPLLNPPALAIAAAAL